MLINNTDMSLRGPLVRQITAEILHHVKIFAQLDRAVFDSSKLFISLIISFKVPFLNENGKATSDGIYFFYL